MKRKSALLCALLLAAVSIFVFVFPAASPTMPSGENASEQAPLASQP